MLTIVIGFIIAIILMAVENILCTRFKNPLWGGIIPMFILIGTVCIFTAEIVPFELNYVFPFIILNTIFFGDWSTGREKYDKIRQAEFEKMKAEDIL